jgi:Fe-S cluster biogenesis protein NfuA
MSNETPDSASIETTIRERLEELRVYLQGHGGDLEVVAIEGKNVQLRLRGACGGCPHAMVTLKDGIEDTLRREIDPEIVVERAE